ncbi:Hypothetical protein SMAX5B_013840 [Scophthalmus maximus]|uniref:Uncharacterized protein n=1 Tax=Scophthalmus maximus TaxID=52904 RepID=A0A2U9CGA5_SCOMX|nr:Hypothetical protein SMAX5B_013840 [Scophthalmus maximus]
MKPPIILIAVTCDDSELLRKANKEISDRKEDIRWLSDEFQTIVGDSIIRNIHYFNATTRCFPGATVLTLLDKLPGLLHSLPSSINRVLWSLTNAVP